MTFSRLVTQLVLAVGVLVLANLAVRWLARNSVPRQVLARGQQSEPATDLFLGNSTMAAGLDEAEFAVAKPGRPLNLAVGATGPVEHLLILRQQDKHQAAEVYYGFLDTQLTDVPDGRWESLVGNRSLAYSVEPEVAVVYFAPDSPAQAFAHRMIGFIPMLTERHVVWSKVELVRRTLNEVGMPRRGTNQFGRADDFSALEAAPDEFAPRCGRAADDLVPLNGPVTAILTHAGRGQRIYVVEMPMPGSHRKRFYSSPEWTRYRRHVNSLVVAAGGVYVPAADWIADDGFSDPLHLNAEGARRFSRLLADWVQK